MNKFANFITEAKEGKNVHLEHIEDEILNRGVVGARDAINFLQSLRDMLAGHAQSKVNVTTKWDGAPAIFCGTNPENGKFFVGTKSVFNKNAKLNYTEDDIDTCVCSTNRFQIIADNASCTNWRCISYLIYRSNNGRYESIF